MSIALAPENIAQACEIAFQNGGPKVYVYEGWRQMPSGMSGKRAAQCAFPGQRVYARQKVQGSYKWVAFRSTHE